MMSFAYIGIYWNNHHHLLQATRVVSGRVMWANLHLLFWLSIVPFGTAWMGENSFAAIPVAVYGALLIMPAIAFSLLVRAIIGVPDQPPARLTPSAATSRAMARSWPTRWPSRLR